MSTDRAHELEQLATNIASNMVWMPQPGLEAQQLNDAHGRREELSLMMHCRAEAVKTVERLTRAIDLLATRSQ